jgi:hypothetical protein
MHFLPTTFEQTFSIIGKMIHPTPKVINMFTKIKLAIPSRLK